MTKNDEEIDHNPYQEYLEKKHASLNTPEELVAKVVKKATKLKFVERERIIAGEVNEVYDVTLQGGKNVIVRISRNKHPRFEAEEKAIRMAAQVGVPTPSVLLIEGLNHGNEKLTFCVEEKINGIPLSDQMGQLSKEELQSLIEQSGSILSKIHSVRVDRFGGFDKLAPYENWSGFVFKPFKAIQRVMKIADEIGVERPLINKAVSTLKEHEGLFNRVTPQLLHGDFSIKHMLIRDKKIVGIIDFENAKGGDPVFDFAWFDYFYGESIPRKWMKKGYSNTKLFDGNFEAKLNLYRLHLSLNLLDYYELEKNSAGLDHTKKKLLKDTSLL